MRIGIVGVGYVGLPSGLTFCSKNNFVIFYDKDIEKIEKLKKGIPIIYEKEIETYLKKSIENKNCKFTFNINDLCECEIIFICTNADILENNEIDIKNILEPILYFSNNFKKEIIIAIKSTILPNYIKIIKENIKNEKIHLVINPEFLREGNAIEDSLKPERIVLGIEDEFSKEKLIKLYSDFNTPIIITDFITASLMKYFSNSFLATKISFINEAANLCETIGANIDDIILGLGLDSRIGTKNMNPGIGFGGYCLVKDTNSLYHFSKKINSELHILKSVIEVNDNQYKLVFKKLIKHFNKLDSLKISIFGITFKKNTDDIRNSIGLKIVEDLTKYNVDINCFDFVNLEKLKIYYPKVVFIKDPYEAVNNSDVIIITNDWEDYRLLDWMKIKKLMKSNIIIDGRNVLDPKVMKDFGFIYEGVGRI